MKFMKCLGLNLHDLPNAINISPIMFNYHVRFHILI